MTLTSTPKVDRDRETVAGAAAAAEAQAGAAAPAAAAPAAAAPAAAPATSNRRKRSRPTRAAEHSTAAPPRPPLLEHREAQAHAPAAPADPESGPEDAGAPPRGRRRGAAATGSYLQDAEMAVVDLGLGRIVALYCRSSTSYQMHEHIRYLYI